VIAKPLDPEVVVRRVRDAIGAWRRRVHNGGTPANVARETADAHEA
jgi:hypothetical protein